MEERRGPDYIPASTWQAKRTRTRRTIWWMVGPAVGITAGFVLVTVYLPQRAADNTVFRLIQRLPHVTNYHSMEYRLRADGTSTLLREEYSQGSERRIELYGGEVIELPEKGLIYEKATHSVRSFMDSSSAVSNTPPWRLANDLYTPGGAKVSVGSSGAIIAQTPTRKILLKMNERRTRPTEWITYYRTERGFEPLSRTVVEFGNQPLSKFTGDDFATMKVEESEAIPNPFARDAKPIQTFKNAEDYYSVLQADVNSRGDLIVVGTTNLDRPFVEIKDDQGHHYSPTELNGNSFTDGGPVYSQQLGIRLEDEPVRWPIKYTFAVRSFDPRYRVHGNTTLGTYTVTFQKPTCYLSPFKWFGTAVAERPYFDFERTRHYRLALMYQNAMRTKSGELVDTLNGGAAAMGLDPGLSKATRDSDTGIEEMREVLRSRAQFDSGTLSVASLYVTLAEMYERASRGEEAIASVNLAKDLAARGGISDPVLDASIERLSRELNQ